MILVKFLSHVLTIPGGQHRRRAARPGKRPFVGMVYRQSGKTRLRGNFGAVLGICAARPAPGVILIVKGGVCSRRPGVSVLGVI